MGDDSDHDDGDDGDGDDDGTIRSWRHYNCDTILSPSTLTDDQVGKGGCVESTKAFVNPSCTTNN